MSIAFLTLDDKECLFTKSKAECIDYFVRMRVTFSFRAFNSAMQICKENFRKSNEYV